MAESLINIKRRINTIKSTEKITKAMKLTSSVKFQRWKNIFESCQPYLKEMEDNLKKALSNDFSKIHLENECVVNHPSQKKLFVVLSSSLGLCGGYNYYIYKEIDSKISSNDDTIAIGEKGKNYLKNKNNNINISYIDFMNDFSYSHIKKLRHKLIQLYRTGQYCEIDLIYTKYINSLNSIPSTVQLLPLILPEYNSVKNSDDFETLLEPSKKEVLDTLIPHYLDTLIYKYFINSELSEVASRRNAMEQASDNASDMISELSLKYNKNRQTIITQEITEVVAGATSKKKMEY